MVVVGADVHKRSHTFVAVDAVGKQLGQLTVDATTKGHHKALAWVRKSFLARWCGRSRIAGTCRPGWSGTC
jgi:hypothetical protein